MCVTIKLCICDKSFMKSVGTFNGYEIVYKGLSIEDM